MPIHRQCNASACLLLFALIASSEAAVAEQTGEPLLYRKIQVPEPLCRTITTEAGKTVIFGGDVRLGDLTGNHRADLLVFRSTDGGMKPVFIGAFTMKGEILWQVGSGGQQPNRPGPVAIHDIDGDRQSEVIALSAKEGTSGSWLNLANAVLQIRDGATGKLDKQAASEVLRNIRTTTRYSKWNAPNWVHQRILIGDFRGTGRPQDFVIKLGLHVLAFDENLELLWSYTIPEKWKAYGRHTAYIPAVGDIDADKRDEVLGGYYLLDDAGRPLWEQRLGSHMDSVAIAEWDNGHMRAICSGHGHVMDAKGCSILSLGGKLVPHGQEVRIRDFVETSAGPEMALRYDGHSRNVLVVSNQGEILHKLRLNASSNNTGMEAVDFHGADEPVLLYNGGMLWTASGKSLGRLPELPKAETPVKPRQRPGWRMGWYHCIPANLCGDEQEELLLYNPWDAAVFVYTAAPLDESAYSGYQPTARQYNPRLMD